MCRNEVDTIEKTLNSIQGLSNDIIVYDTGSTDGTLKIVQKYNIRLFTGEWVGYGKTKRIATALCSNDWVFSLDADEVLDDKLRHELSEIKFHESTSVYRIKMKTFLGAVRLRWGQWGFDKRIRIFNKNVVNWNEDLVHEKLLTNNKIAVYDLKGCILHYSFKNLAHYSQKMELYAQLCADKYYSQGRKATLVKRYLGPAFLFFKHYFLMLGFLDGKLGFSVAKIASSYTFKKYKYLHQIQILGK
jgi:glycosyltransferase involved in cell wall biosynthesis